MMDCVKFGDFSLRHFGLIVRTDRQNHSQADNSEADDRYIVGASNDSYSNSTQYSQNVARNLPDVLNK